MNSHRSIPTLFEKAISRPRKIGGQLLFLCLALTVLAPAFTAFEFFTISQLDFSSLPGVTTWAVTAFVLGELIIRPYGVYVGIALWRIRPNAVKLAKEYFILNIAICLVQLLFVAQVGLVGDSARQECMVAIVVSIMWFRYLQKSQRVKDTFGALGQEKPIAVTETSATRKPGSLHTPINASNTTYTLVSSPVVLTEPKAPGSKDEKQSPVVTIPTKRLVIRSASAGAAFALILVLAAVGALLWYRGHLKTPITAEFIKLDTSTVGGTTHTNLQYQLHNHTQDSYLFERLLVEARMDDGRLTPVLYDTNDKDELSMWVPMILPAKDNVLFILTVKGDFSKGGGSIVSFVLFDDQMRFRIDLPKGW